MAIKGYWKLNGNSNDYSGNGNNGTDINAQYIAGLSKTSVYYPNTNNGYTSFKNILNFTSENFTFSTWVKIYSFSTSVSGQTPVIFSKSSYGIAGYYCQIESTRFYFGTCQSGAAQFTIANYSFQINTWYHIAVTRNGSSVKLYVNGIDKTSSAGNHVSPASTSADFYINKYLSSGINVMSNMQYDDFFAANTTYSPAQIKNEYARVKGFF